MSHVTRGIKSCASRTQSLIVVSLFISSSVTGIVYIISTGAYVVLGTPDLQIYVYSYGVNSSSFFIYSIIVTNHKFLLLARKRIYNRD